MRHKPSKLMEMISVCCMADQLLHYEVEGRVDGLVEDVEELGNQWAELLDKQVNKMFKEVTEETKQIEVLTRGREATVGMTWEEYKALMRKELCLNNKMQKLETEFWYHTMVRANHAAYTDHFHELARLVPHLLPLRTK
nr:reverse transcriptase domain-containing protein [Tanacetum cinerariifolium]